MRPQPDNPPSVRRIVLPSGRTIEVAFYPSVDPPEPDAPARALHLCDACGSDLVHPVAWQEAGPTHWEVDLRCPNCGLEETGVFDQATVDRFDDELDRGTRALVRDLTRLTHANMEDEVERFVAALHAEHIVPDDF